MQKGTNTVNVNRRCSILKTDTTLPCRFCVIFCSVIIIKIKNREREIVVVKDLDVVLR